MQDSSTITKISLYIQQQQWNLAEATAHQALRQNPQQISIYHSLIDIYLAQNNQQSLIKLQQYVLKQYPHLSDSFLNYLKQKQTQQNTDLHIDLELAKLYLEYDQPFYAEKLLQDTPSDIKQHDVYQQLLQKSQLLQ